MDMSFQNNAPTPKYGSGDHRTETIVSLSYEWCGKLNNNHPGVIVSLTCQKKFQTLTIKWLLEAE